MTNMKIIRVLDDEKFFIGAGRSSRLQQLQFVEVLSSNRSSKNLGQIIEIFDQYAICKRVGEEKVYFGDTVVPRTVDYQAVNI
ncbi:hypothetical protein K0019_08915 [Staphylococcus massiliensis]|nr:hypothetical protein [Staphylococcus massiliensis]MCG3400278.1 hypothetical protein [Staphylococcus massiliensis]